MYTLLALCVCVYMYELCHGVRDIHYHKRLTGAAENRISSLNKARSLDEDYMFNDLEHPNEAFRAEWERTLARSQEMIIQGLGNFDGIPFKCDKWTKGDNMDEGFGRSCALQNGNVFEKAAVNMAVVYGELPEEAIVQMNSKGRVFTDFKENFINRAGRKTVEDIFQRYKAGHNEGFDGSSNKTGRPWYYAAGVSMVIHPWNPKAPTTHMNYRMFQVFDPQTKETLSWWFGGGSDLTPSYVYEEDAVHFHTVLKKFCDKHDRDYYPLFKKWADVYYRITHRQETRGVGGIFFDDLNNKKPIALKRFCEDGFNSFLHSYVPIMQKRFNESFTEKQKEWQQIRRGRYVEFNLMYDRGTKFGLNIPGSRVESILLSMPLTARWEYDHKPPANSWEDISWKIFRNPRDWI